MATRTSTQSGNLSDSATWGGSAFNDGDIAVISVGTAVTVDVNKIMGSKSAGVGLGFDVKGTDASNFGRLIIPDGITLTVRGFDTTTNRAGLVRRYGKLELNGGRLLIDGATAYSTFVEVDGYCITAAGASGNSVIQGDAAPNWNNAVTNETLNSSTQRPYDPRNHIAIAIFAHQWIANAAGSGAGSFGDSSFAFNGSPSPSLTTEVASIAAITGAGKYYINYDAGFLYWYDDGTFPGSIHVDYKYLTFVGQGLVGVGSTGDSELQLDHCTFRYMGDTAGSTPAVSLDSYKSASVASGRRFFFTSCRFDNCKFFVLMTNCTGASGDTLPFTSCYFGSSDDGGGVFQDITARPDPCAYIEIGSCALNVRFGIFNAAATCDHLRIHDCSGFVGSSIIAASSIGNCPDLLCENLTINGSGGSNNQRGFDNVAGTSGHPAVIRNNTLSYFSRIIHVAGQLEFYGNTIINALHHGVTGTTSDEVALTHVIIKDNVFFGSNGGLYTEGSAMVEIGYNHRMWYDDVQVLNNTFIGCKAGAISIGDIQDESTVGMTTGLVVAGNLVYGGDYAFVRNATDANERNLAHVLLWDYNLAFGQAIAAYDGQWTRGGGRFSKGGINYCDDSLVTRNVKGVALYDANFSSASGKQLDFIYASATDQKLQWDGGTQIQLVFGSGTATGGDTATLIDAGAAWSTDRSNATCPVCYWVKITGGTGSGQIRVITNNTATSLSVAPLFSPAPDATSTYIIVKSEVTLVDGADTVKAGIDLRLLPTSTKQDTTISYADHLVTGDPLLVSTTSLSPSAAKFRTGSPAIDVASPEYFSTPDFFGVTRTTPDIGFAEGAALGNSESLALNLFHLGFGVGA